MTSDNKSVKIKPFDEKVYGEDWELNERKEIDREQTRLDISKQMVQLSKSLENIIGSKMDQKEIDRYGSEAAAQYNDYGNAYITTPKFKELTAL